MTTQERQRFEKTVKKTRSCWLWTGVKDRDGYGIFWFRRRNRRAHRVAYWASVGEIPPGRHVDHTCQRQSCVRPDHLRHLTAREHMLTGKSAPALNAKKTHCPRKHPYDRTYGNQRYCSICEREKKRRLTRKWRAADTLSC